MKKKLSKVLAVCLSVAVLFATIIPESVYATQIQTGDTEQQITVSENDTISKNEIEAFGEEGKLNYLYLERNYIEAPGSEQILVSFGDEETVISNATLTVENYESKEKSNFYSEETMDNTVLFTMDYTAEDQGIYEAVSVSVTTADGKTKQVTFSKTGMDNVYFGVNEEVVLSEEKPLLTDETVEMQIITFDESNAADVSSEEISDAVEGALDEAETNIEDETWSVSAPLSAISTMNLGTVAIPSEKASQGNLVVVLDPGHDSTHAGARANGLKEEELTLKIAKYCKEELEKYAGVTVYMTRSSSSCPFPGTSSTDDNANRVAYAQSVGADVFVSIHLNSASSSSASGAEVFYPNSNYNSAIGSAGANLSAQISRQLAALGLNNRGITIRNSADGTRYPDGSLADYYGVIRRSKLAGFPAVIIEHAFLTNASDAAFLSNEDNLKKLGIADATGIANYYGLLQEINVISNAPTINNFNNTAGTFTASVTGVSPVSGVSKVKAAVWSDVNGQDDLIWYTASDAGNGIYTVNVDISKHKADAGNYSVHVYADDKLGKSHFLGATTCKFEKVIPTIKTLNTVVSSDERSVTIVATGVANIASLKYAVWSDTNGQDDLIWYTATNNGNGTWTAIVPISSHKGSLGVYNVHAYANNAYYTNKFMTASSFLIDGPKVGKVVVKNVNDSVGTFRAEVTGISAKSGVSKVEIAVWSKSDQSNLKWYTATRQSDGSYAVDVNIANHKYEYGTYQVHAYVTDNNGAKAFTYNTVTMKQPVAVVKAIGNATQTRYTITASNVGYAGGVKGVQIAVWSDENGQDDLNWYQAENNGGVWSADVPIINHKSAGRYNVHVYLTDINGNQHFAGNTYFSVDRPSAGKVVVKNVNDAAGTFRAEVTGISAKSGVSKVEIAVWSKSDQSNLKWYTATRQSDGSYAVDVNIANHKYEYGTYQVHVYATDNNGVKAFTYNTVTMVQPMAVVKAIGNATQTRYTITASNVGYAGGVKGVRIAVWSDENGQDDLIWYQAENNGGVWSANVPTINHKSAGRYNVHVYLTDIYGNSHFSGATNFGVTRITVDEVSVIDKRENDGTFGVKITGVSSVSGVKEVKVAVWCAPNQSDLIWYTATDLGSGNYQIGVDVRNHQSNTGTYQAHVYITGYNEAINIVGSAECSIINVTNMLHPIMGSSSVTVDQMVAYYNSITSYPAFYADTEAPTIQKFCQIYLDECNAEGVKAEVAFVQAMKETNFLRYGGDVDINQYNFAGIGATGNGAKGNSFPSVTIGIRAQVQHLKAYASNESLNQACVDPRFRYVARNTAPYCEWLGIKENPYGKGWATAVNYGYNIVERVNNLKTY